MAVKITEQMYDTFTSNGYTEDDIKNTVNHYREQGMPDSEIFTNMNKKHRELAGIKDVVTPQMGDQPNYDDILNNPALNPQQQAQQIQEQGEAYRAGLDKDLATQKAKMRTGAAIKIASPLVGLGLAPFTGGMSLPASMATLGLAEGATFGVGEALQNQKRGGEFAKDVATQGLLGGLMGAGTGALFKGASKVLPKIFNKHVNVPKDVQELGELASNPQAYVAKTGRPVGLSRLPKEIVPLAEAPTVGEAPIQQVTPNKFNIEAEQNIPVEQTVPEAQLQQIENIPKVEQQPINEVFYTPQGTEIIKNPTSTQYRELINAHNKEFPNDISGNPEIRRTFDEIGNEYAWRASDSVHAFVEPVIEKKIGSKVNQDISTLNWATAKENNITSKINDYRNAVENGYRGKFLDFAKKQQSTNELAQPSVSAIEQSAPEMVQPQEIKSLNKQSLQKGLNIELQKIKDSIEIPEVTKGTYVQGRYKNRFFQKNITDDMTRGFIDADISLQQTIKEIKRNPSVINDYDRLETELEKQVSKLPQEAQMEYYNKFHDAIGKAVQHEDLKATQLTPESLGFNAVDVPQGQVKTRGGIKTVGTGLGEDVAKAVSDTDYTTRGLKVNQAEFANLAPEQQMDLVNTDDISDLSIYAKIDNLKNKLNAGELPQRDLNKFVKQGTEQGQAMQARTAANMNTPVGALVGTQSVIRKATPKRINDIIDNADNIVAQTKKITEEINVEKQSVQQQFDEWLAKQQQPKTKKILNEKGDRLALGKAMERYRIQKEKELVRLEEKRIKTIENMIKDKEVSPKNRKYLIDNILKLEDLGGLTPDNVIKLVNKKYNIPEINQSDVAKIKELTNRISEATTERESEVAKGLLRKFMVDKVPKTMRNKVNTYRYINMLLSPKSRSKDFIFTAAFQGEQMIDELFAQLPAMASRVFKGINTRSGLQPKAWVGGLKKGFKEGTEDVRLGIETGRAGEGTRYDLPRGQQFAYTPLKDIGVEPNVIKKIAMAGENVLSKLEKALNYTIRVPDRMFYEAKYASSIADQLKAAGVKEPTSEMIEQAVKEAKDAVYQGDTWASRISLGTRDLLNKVPTGAVKVGDLTMPFVQTVANISEEGLKNVGGLPVGMAKWGAAKTPAELRDAELLIGKGLKSLGYLGVGGGIAAGAIKSNIGDLSTTGGYENAVTGMQPQSIAIGDKSFSLANAPNVTIPIGIYRSLLEQGTPQERAARAAMTAMSAIGDMPAFKTLGDLSKGVGQIAGDLAQEDLQGAQESAVQMGNQQIANIVGQHIPLVGFMGNIRNIVDPYSREQYSQNLGQYIGNKTINRIPFASQSLPLRYGITGEPVMMTNIKNPIARTAGELFDPFSVRNYTPNPTIDTMKNLTEQTQGIKGNKAFNIKKAKRSIDINGVRTKLSPKEYSQYQKDYGKINYYLRQKALNSKTWKMSNSEEKIKYMRELNSSIDQAVKSVLFNHSPKKQAKFTQEIIDNYDTFTK